MAQLVLFLNMKSVEGIETSWDRVCLQHKGSASWLVVPLECCRGAGTRPQQVAGRVSVSTGSGPAGHVFALTLH